MVDRNVFDRRLAKLEQLLRKLRGLQTVDLNTFLKDQDVQARAERWLQVAIECALDLTHHLIAERGWQTPTTYREAFEVLHQEGLLDSEQAAQMADWAGLRNILVHLYLEIDHRLLHQFLQQDLGQVEAFARILAEAVARED